MVQTEFKYVIAHIASMLIHHNKYLSCFSQSRVDSGLYIYMRHSCHFLPCSPGGRGKEHSDWRNSSQAWIYPQRDY